MSKKTKQTASESGLNFSQALKSLKGGNRISRADWTEHGMYLWLVSDAKVGAFDDQHDESLRKIAGDLNGKVELLPYICLLTADKKVMLGWVPSWRDILAEDWLVLD